MQLVRWKTEPAVSQLLAIFKGPESDFRKFLKLWFEWRGGLDLSIASLNPDAVPWIKIVSKPASAFAVSIKNAPAYFLVGRWTQDRHWSLFYKSGAKTEQTDEPKRTETITKPRGTYLPWGFLAEESHTSEAERDEIVLVLPESNASTKRVVLRPIPAFGDITTLPGLQTIVSGLDGPVRPSVATDRVPVNSSAYILPLRLVTARNDEQSSSPRDRVNRLQRDINRMQEQLDTLRWWCEVSEVLVYLNIYPETPSYENGSFWELRDWFASASDQAIEQFSHLRITVDSLREEFPPDGALHLVRPTRFESEPTAALPRPRNEFRFLLDQRWKQKKRTIFVPEGYELWPPPPWNNEHVTDLLTSCLWEGGDTNDTLILMRMPDREYRFTVRGFRPLAQQVKALNVKVATTRATHTTDPMNTAGMEAMLAQCRKDVQSHISSHAKQIKEVLDGLWNEERADLNRYYQQVREALNQIAKITEINKDLDTFTKTNWRTWAEFREEVLRLDEKMLPPQRKGVDSQLRQLENIRMQLAMLWQNDTEQRRRQLVTAIRILAATIEQSNER